MSAPMRAQRVAVCTTLAAFVMDNEYTYGYWCSNAEEIKLEASKLGIEVIFFAAIETDGRGIEPFQKLLDRLSEIDGEHWTYSLDDHRTIITTPNRLLHLTMGQNLSSAFASDGHFDWMLFLAADAQAPNDVIPRLLEVDHPLVGFEIPTYCLNGPAVERYTEFPVQEQMISAAGIMIHRDVFKVLRWRTDVDMGMTDDPAYQHDAMTILGIPEYVRKDCIGKHYPECIGPIETRFRNRDMRVY